MIMLEYSNMMPFNQFGGICVTRFLDFETLGYNQTFSESWVGAVFSFDQTFSKSLEGAVFGFDQTFSKSLDFKVFSFGQTFSKSLEVKSCLLE